MGMTKTPTTRSATARLMMNKLETYFFVLLGLKINHFSRVDETGNLENGIKELERERVKFESFQSGNKSIGSHLILLPTLLVLNDITFVCFLLFIFFYGFRRLRFELLDVTLFAF